MAKGLMIQVLLALLSVGSANRLRAASPPENNTCVLVGELSKSTGGSGNVWQIHGLWDVSPYTKQHLIEVAKDESIQLPPNFLEATRNEERLLAPRWKQKISNFHPDFDVGAIEKLVRAGQAKAAKNYNADLSKMGKHQEREQIREFFQDDRYRKAFPEDWSENKILSFMMHEMGKHFLSEMFSSITKNLEGMFKVWSSENDTMRKRAEEFLRQPASVDAPPGVRVSLYLQQEEGKLTPIMNESEQPLIVAEGIVPLGGMTDPENGDYVPVTLQELVKKLQGSGPIDTQFSRRAWSIAGVRNTFEKELPLEVKKKMAQTGLLKTLKAAKPIEERHGSAIKTHLSMMSPESGTQANTAADDVFERLVEPLLNPAKVFERILNRVTAVASSTDDTEYTTRCPLTWAEARNVFLEAANKEFDPSTERKVLDAYKFFNAEEGGILRRTYREAAQEACEVSRARLARVGAASPSSVIRRHLDQKAADAEADLDAMPAASSPARLVVGTPTKSGDAPVERLNRVEEALVDAVVDLIAKEASPPEMEKMLEMETQSTRLPGTPLLPDGSPEASPLRQRALRFSESPLVRRVLDLASALKPLDENVATERLYAEVPTWPPQDLPPLPKMQENCEEATRTVDKPSATARPFGMDITNRVLGENCAPAMKCDTITSATARTSATVRRPKVSPVRQVRQVPRGLRA